MGCKPRPKHPRANNHQQRNSTAIHGDPSWQGRRLATWLATLPDVEKLGSLDNALVDEENESHQEAT
jgi:hypothetical protein